METDHHAPGAIDAASTANSDHGTHHHPRQGHDKHAGHDPEMFRRLFWWNLALAIPVAVFSEQVQTWFGYTINDTLTTWVPPVLGTVVYLWGGRPFLTGAVAEIRSRAPGMMLLIALAITVAYTASLLTSLDVVDLDFWWELAALITVMLLGHWQEMKAIGQARGALAALAELLPDTAERVDGESVTTIGLSDLVVGDIVLVRPGGRVPADGTIVEGHAAFDESMITGESRPIDRAVGDTVTAGTVSTNSSLRVQVAALGDDTALAGIQRLVAAAQQSRSQTQVLADRAAAALFYLAVSAAIITAIAWAIAGQPSEGIVRVVTVLVIACPHALGLAIPLVTSISTATAARNGILVKDRLALEPMRNVDAVLFDKTGTLTLGNHAVTDHVAIAGRDADEILRLAGGVETQSEHPIARAIVAAAPRRLPHADHITSLTGLGVTGTIDNATIAVGGPALLDHLGTTEPRELHKRVEQWRRTGSSVLYVTENATVIGALTLADQIRPESPQVVRDLHQRGVHVALITGDATQVANHVADQLGIDEVFADVLPADKDAKVTELQTRGLTVAMVGDGVNDAPALARADVGLAIGAGTDVAIESAGVILASSSPAGVTNAIDLSTATYRKMIQNLIWATGYNLAAIPIAAGALAFAGINIPPAAAAIAMSLSTIIVAVNAQALRRLRLR